MSQRSYTRPIAITIAVLLTLLFVGVSMARAHGSGSSFEKQVDETLIDIGYSVEEFSVDSSVVFDFAIQDLEDAPIVFTDVWVRIVREGTTVFASGIHNSNLGGALMTYTFPTEGEYSLMVRFQNNGETVVESNFPLTVLPSNDSKQGNWFLLIIGLCAGVLVGSGIWLVIQKRDSRT